MSESTEIAALLLAQVQKLLKSMSDDDVKQLVSGEAKLSLVPRGHRVVEYTPGVDRTLRYLEGLTPGELELIDARQATIKLLRKGEKIVKPFDPIDVAEHVTRLATEGEIVRYLDSDSTLGAPNLKKVATALNLPLPPSVKSKQALQLYIAENVVRDRSRWSLR